MSRWTMPCACAAVRARAVCRPMSATASRASFFSRRSRTRSGLAVDQLLHHEVAALLGLADLVDRDDVRMIERRGGLGLAQEPRHRRVAVALALGQDLDRDRPVEPQVVGRGRPRPCRRARSACRCGSGRSAVRSSAGRRHARHRRSATVTSVTRILPRKYPRPGVLRSCGEAASGFIDGISLTIGSA